MLDNNSSSYAGKCAVAYSTDNQLTAKHILVNKIHVRWNYLPRTENA